MTIETTNDPIIPMNTLEMVERAKALWAADYLKDVLERCMDGIADTIGDVARYFDTTAESIEHLDIDDDLKAEYLDDEDHMSQLVQETATCKGMKVVEFAMLIGMEAEAQKWPEVRKKLMKELAEKVKQHVLSELRRAKFLSADLGREKRSAVNYLWDAIETAEQRLHSILEPDDYWVAERKRWKEERRQRKERNGILTDGAGI